MKSNLNILIILLFLYYVMYSKVPVIQNFPFGLEYRSEMKFENQFPFLPSPNLQDPDYYDKIKLKDITFDCETYYLYPVFIEDFNYISDVEQNFQFWSGYSHNDVDLAKLNNCNQNKPVTYYGDNTFAKNNGNVKCINGELILERKLQNVVINSSNYSSIQLFKDTTDLHYKYLNKKNRWYAGMFYTTFFIHKYGFATPMIGYRHLNKNGTFFGFTTLIIPEFDISILYSFLVSGYQLGVPLNNRRNLFFYLENGPMYFYTSKNLWHVPNFYLNYERCFSKKLAYSIQTGGYIGPALGEKSKYMGLMRGSMPVERKIVYGFSIKLNIRFV